MTSSPNRSEDRNEPNFNSGHSPIFFLNTPCFPARFFSFHQCCFRFENSRLRLTGLFSGTLVTRLPRKVDFYFHNTNFSDKKLSNLTTFTGAPGTQNCLADYPSAGFPLTKHYSLHLKLILDKEVLHPSMKQENMNSKYYIVKKENRNSVMSFGLKTELHSYECTTSVNVNHHRINELAGVPTRLNDGKKEKRKIC
ncbi:unnamed protein product [Larinioides sclopetarius]|uniref:Uncharacterized protein n=1 Tax=Larinioides sclopetarius TaxID=280406 RepID=A0AAV2B348_9ARAC